MRRFRGRFVMALAVVTASVGLVSAAGADEKKDKAKATGTWKSTFTTQDGQTRTTTFKLKQEGEKLSGVVVGRNNTETAIENGTVKGDELSFQVTREFNNNKFTFKYQGKVSGETIKGKVEFEREGQARSRDWEAKREAEPK